MKEMYVKPVASLIEVETTTMLAASGDLTIGVTDKNADNNYDALSNDRRGNWGDLWD